MPTRDQDCCRTGACREEVFELLFSGRFPSERHVELLLDRLERENPLGHRPEPGGPR